MKLVSKGPNLATIYKYMKCKGYDANFNSNSGKRFVIFVKTIHNPQFPKSPSLKGLVVLHKIELDVTVGSVNRHWLENRGLSINCREYLQLLEELQEESIKVYNAIKEWMKRDWLYQAIAELENKNSNTINKNKGIDFVNSKEDLSSGRILEIKDNKEDFE